MGYVATREQVPFDAVGEDTPTTDEPRIAKKEALVARKDDLAVRIGDEHEVTLVGRKLRRSDFSVILLPARCSGGGEWSGIANP